MPAVVDVAPSSHYIPQVIFILHHHCLSLLYTEAVLGFFNLLLLSINTLINISLPLALLVLDESPGGRACASCTCTSPTATLPLIFRMDCSGRGTALDLVHFFKRFSPKFYSLSPCVSGPNTSGNKIDAGSVLVSFSPLYTSKIRS